MSRMKVRLDQFGQTLTEMMMAVAIGSIVSLGVASVFTYGMRQFAVLREQNLTQENLLQAAYYTRSFLSQAVKTTCCQGNTCYNFSSPVSNPNYQAIADTFSPSTPSTTGNLDPAGFQVG
ncbi:MAG: prepilin-type N-terminal cleavage/methylation domain-containing protein, partial [Oligoflexia bacterium]|nr:prepilin-type N-terminal cleavage/methylation domain-containing protein [Oligoflexia bacterium]